MTELMVLPQMIVLEEQPSARSPAEVYLGGLLTEGGRRTMRQALNTIAAMEIAETDYLTFPWVSLRYEHLVDIRARLASQYAPATVNKMMAAVKGTLKVSWLMGQMDGDLYRKAVSVEPVPGKGLPKGRYISPQEIQSLHLTCTKAASTTGIRDWALVMVLLRVGLRVAELCDLDLEDLDLEGRHIRVRKAKGQRPRVLPVPEPTCIALLPWLSIRENAAGALFYPVHKGGFVHPGRLTQQSIYAMLQTRARQANIKRLSPHDFRRTCAGDLLTVTDLVTAQHYLGHTSVETTAGYDRRPEEEMRKAVDLVDASYL